MKLSNYKIGTKLTGAFLIVALLVVVTGIVGFMALNIVGNEMDNLLDVKVPSKDGAMEAVIAALSGRDASAEYMINSTDNEAIKYEINESIDDFDMWIKMIVLGTNDS